MLSRQKTGFKSQFIFPGATASIGTFSCTKLDMDTGSYKLVISFSFFDLLQWPRSAFESLFICRFCICLKFPFLKRHASKKSFKMPWGRGSMGMSDCTCSANKMFSQVLNTTTKKQFCVCIFLYSSSQETVFSANGMRRVNRVIGTGLQERLRTVLGCLISSLAILFFSICSTAVKFTDHK